MPQGNKIDIRWFPPSHDRVKINFDGSVQSNYAARGFIVRTETGKSLAAACFDLGTTTVPVAEAIALRNSLIYPKNQGLSETEVESDYKLVIDVVNGVSSLPWKLLKLVQDIKALSSSFEFVIFKHVFRETNFVANLGHRVDNMNMWEKCVLSKVFSALNFDVVNIRCVKDTSI